MQRIESVICFCKTHSLSCSHPQPASERTSFYDCEIIYIFKCNKWQSLRKKVLKMWENYPLEDKKKFLPIKIMEICIVRPHSGWKQEKLVIHVSFLNEATAPMTWFILATKNISFHPIVQLCSTFWTVKFKI